MKRLLVTGATGFIGRHCLRLLLNGGYDEIHAVSRSDKARDASVVTWHSADLRLAPEAARIIDAVQPTHLFHAAWVATPSVYVSSPENIDWMQATTVLVRTFAENGGQRFVGFGSSAEYAPSEELCEEDRTPLRPSSIYGMAKLATWCAVQTIADLYKMEAAWGRVFLAFGPGEPLARLIPAAVAALRVRKPLPLSHGLQERDFVYAPDAAELLVRLLASPATGAFNIASGERRTVRFVIEAIAQCLDASDCLRFGELPLRAEEAPVLVADMRKAREQLGFGAPTPLAEALDNMLASGRI